MDSASSETIYQVNLYYGIHYPAELTDKVVEALNTSAFRSLALDEEYERDGAKFMRNVNSETDESRGIILADNMTVTGAESSSPAAFCNFDPVDLVASEERERPSVEICTDIYDVIVAHFKKSKYSITELRCGWAAYNCEWCGDESSSEESAEAPARARKAVPVQKTTQKQKTAPGGPKGEQKPTVPKTAQKKPKSAPKGK